MTNISFTADIILGVNEFVCDVSLFEDSAKITVLQPREIEGLIFEYTDGSVSGNYKNAEFKPYSNKLPNSAISQQFYDIVYDIKRNNYTAISDENNCVISEKLNNYTYVFTFSPTGLPISLEIKDLDFKAQFNNVTIEKSG